MKSRPSLQSAFAHIVAHPIWLFFPAISVLCAGCFAPRDYSAWINPSKNVGQYAVLPVVPSQVRIAVQSAQNSNAYEISFASTNVNQTQAARIINSVLDTIAGGENDALEGPGKVGAALKHSSEWENFQVYLRDPGPLDEPWKREGLANISRALGYQRVICVYPMLRFNPNLSSNSYGAAGAEITSGQLWDGNITVEIQMMDLVNSQVVGSGTGQADFYAVAGVAAAGGYGAAIAVPYTYGKSFDRAADQTIRKALNELFSVPLKKGVAK
jgi:hypothetical protein